MKKNEDVENLLAKILYEYESWYLDEGDYQPTQEQALKKSRKYIEEFKKLIIDEIFTEINEPLVGYTDEEYVNWLIEYMKSYEVKS